MKRVVLFALMSVLTINLFAYKTYCKFRFYEYDLFAKNRTYFDFGTGYKAILYDENNKRISFESDIDVLNYMGKLGWKLEQSTIPEVDKTGGKCEYILSKEIKIDDEIIQGLNVKFDK